jgi:hypothetical protein
MYVDIIDCEAWDELSDMAQISTFEERRPAYMNKIDYALGVRTDNDIISWVTVRELDHESVYWQYGGCLPKHRNTLNSFKSYKMMKDFCFKNGIKYISTLVESDNIVMLKMAFKIGFRIIGTKSLDNTTYVDLYLDGDKLCG